MTAHQLELCRHICFLSRSEGEEYEKGSYLFFLEVRMESFGSKENADFLSPFTSDLSTTRILASQEIKLDLSTTIRYKQQHALPKTIFHQTFSSPGRQPEREIEDELRPFFRAVAEQIEREVANDAK